MPGKKFLDTNVFGYTFDQRDARKQNLATQLIARLIQERQAAVSFQVVHEFVNLAMKSKIPGLDVSLAQRYVMETFGKMTLIPSSLAIVERGLSLQPKTRLPWFDCLMIAAALEAGCETIYTEDLQHGQKIERIMVINPFL